MARGLIDLRVLFLLVAAIFIYIQVRLFATQSQYADRLAAAEKAENQCVSESRMLIDQISKQQERIVGLEEKKLRQDEERAQLKMLIQDLQKKLQLTSRNKGEVPVAAVVVMACNRPDYLERTIQSILKYQTSVASKFPLFISQDGANTDVKNKALSFTDITFMQHIDSEPVETERPGELIAYYKIARHYKWALDELFIKHNFSRVIILEDDMEIAPDFFEYFEATATLLDTDPTIMAVSSWNDNGQQQFVNDPEALYRSDFFPGLGWMLTKTTWEELSPKWPKAYWDDWVRLKEVHKDRQFIHPEVCRTYNFGEHYKIIKQLQNESKINIYIPGCLVFYPEQASLSCNQGSSMGQFFQQYLQPIRLNDVQVNWKSADLSYLKEENFRKKFAKEVLDAKPLQGSDAILKAHNMEGDVRIQYNDQRDFERIARQFGIFEEWKDGIPRTAYKGVVVFRYNKTRRRIFLVASDSLQQLGV